MAALLALPRRIDCARLDAQRQSLHRCGRHNVGVQGLILERSGMAQYLLATIGQLRGPGSPRENSLPQLNKRLRIGRRAATAAQRTS